MHLFLKIIYLVKYVKSPQPRSIAVFLREILNKKKPGSQRKQSVTENRPLNIEFYESEQQTNNKDRNNTSYVNDSNTEIDKSDIFFRKDKVFENESSEYHDIIKHTMKEIDEMDISTKIESNKKRKKSYIRSDENTRCLKKEIKKVENIISLLKSANNIYSQQISSSPVNMVYKTEVKNDYEKKT
ncbi:hypothetical protein CDIK_3124 [Cucumispora dikerogammari]|nr:hypothetical protein CDIK_3124 [Cucumispora dikerogammari]